MQRSMTGCRSAQVCLLAAHVLWVAGCTGPMPESTDVTDTAIAQGDKPLYAWLEYGATGLEARSIVAVGTACPTVVVGSRTTGMTVRAAAGPDFPVVSCVAPVKVNAGFISVGGIVLPAPSSNPERILVLGDTGCRISSGWYENCNGNGTGAPWSFLAAARAAAAETPDLIVHVGDYVYREAACNAGKQPGCAGSPWGDKWETWETDFFVPSLPLLDVAPWIVTRGNHEDCGRNHLGWLRFLDGRALAAADLTPAGCPQFSAPYKVAFGDIDFLVLDTTTDPDTAGLKPSGEIRYANDFTRAAAMITAARRTWTVTHRPFWALAPDWRDPTKLGVTDTTLQAAIARIPGGGWPAEVEMSLAGHIHLLETVSFPDSRPHQVVSGDAGTAQDSAITPAAIAKNPQVFSQLGIKPADFNSYHDFGYVLLEREAAGGWQVNVKDLSGQILEQFYLD